MGIGISSHQNHNQQVPQTQICDVCGESNYPVNYGLLVSRPVFGQIFHSTHLHDGTPACRSCEKLQTRNEKYIDLGDQRTHCSDCISTGIFKYQKVESLSRNVHQFFKHMNIKIKRDIPVLLADSLQMIHSSKGIFPKAPMGITTMRDGERVMTVTNCFKINDKIQAVKEAKELRANRRSPTILLLFGLPRVIMGTTLAHEFMHVWFELQGLHRYIEEDVEEGMCELIGQLWLKWCTTEGQFETRLKDFELSKIRKGISISTKNSYKNVKRAVDKYGLKTTLDYMERWKVLPQ